MVILNNRARAVPPLIDSTLRGISKGTLHVSSVFSYIVMSTLVIDVLVRFLTGKPIIGVFEVVSVCAVFLGFYGLPHMIVTDQEIRVDLISKRFTGKGASVLAIVYAILRVSAFALLTYGSWQAYAWNYQQSTLFGQTVELPFWIPWFLLSIILTLCSVVAVWTLVISVRRLKNGSTLNC